MANEQNLMSVEELNSRRTPEQHSADSRKAGIASGKARRRKKNLREAIDMMMSLKVTDKKLIAQMEKLGVDTTDMDYQTAMVVGMVSKAIKGDSSAFNTLRDTVGEKPVDNIEMNTNMGDSLANMMDSLRKGSDLE